MNTPSPPAPIAAAMVATPDADDGREPDAGQDDARRERQLDAAEQLAVGHAQAAPPRAPPGRRR